jgi:hypothetical protein
MVSDHKKTSLSYTGISLALPAPPCERFYQSHGGTIEETVSKRTQSLQSKRRALITARTVGTKTISRFLHGGTCDFGWTYGASGVCPSREAALKGTPALTPREHFLLLCVHFISTFLKAIFLLDFRRFVIPTSLASPRSYRA